MIILYIFIGLLLLFIILALLAPRKYAVERDIVINRPRSEVFGYLKSLRNQDEWSPWAKRDPEMKKEYRGEDERVGFVSSWEGNKEVGKGEQEITDIIENERIETQLRFLKPFKSTSDAYMITEETGEGSTRVRWGFTGKSPVPFNIFMLFMNMDKSAGKDFEEGLGNLKTRMEKQAPNL